LDSKIESIAKVAKQTAQLDRIGALASSGIAAVATVALRAVGVANVFHRELRLTFATVAVTLTAPGDVGLVHVIVVVGRLIPVNEFLTDIAVGYRQRFDRCA
jgi:hypothetical protein